MKEQTNEKREVSKGQWIIKRKQLVTSCQPQKKAAKSEQREANSEWRKSVVEKRDWREERWVARSQQRAIRTLSILESK